MGKEYIPKDKEDLSFIEKLKSMNFREVRDDIPELLEWLQDGNWPQAPLIRNYLIPYINEIEDEIIKILRSSDEMWKYWIINGLLYQSKIEPSVCILNELRRLSTNPTLIDMEAEVDISALNVLNKFGG